MSNFYVGVGGTGAKLMETLIHLSAAGLLANVNGRLNGLLVDPDVANGNVTATRELSGLYDKCGHKRLQCGDTELFKTEVAMPEPWTPMLNQRSATLSTIFGYTQMRENNPIDADLMEILFHPDERDLPIFEGFRGRPAIGSTIFGKAVNFRAGAWSAFRDAIRGAAGGQESVPVVLSGSVFGGSGAAGVPTICRLLEGELEKVTKNARLGLVLFLPYFRFQPVPGEEMQADPHAFPAATAESLKYYDEARFWKTCDTIYALGEEVHAEMRVSAIGAEKQRNDPHFLELIAGLAAVGFMRGEPSSDDHTLGLASRLGPNTVRWADLPVATNQRKAQIARLQRMILFAVAFRHFFYPNIAEDLKANRPRHSFVLNHLIRPKDVSPETAIAELSAVNDYLTAFLNWLLNISTPAGLPNFQPGLVKLSVFAKLDSHGWRLRIPGAGSNGGEFRDKEIEQLFLNTEGRVQPRFNDIWHGADREVTDKGATGTGRLVRAIYDACNLD